MKAVRPDWLAAASLTTVVCVPCRADVIAALPWSSGVTAGPLAQNYPPPNDDHDIWVLEDFSISTPKLLGRFSSRGAAPGQPQHTLDVPVLVLDALPPAGNVILRSTPGAGHHMSGGPGQWDTWISDFGNQRLAPGTYWLMWQADLDPVYGPAVFFVQTGPNSVGGGLPDNAWKYNPGGAWNFPGGVIEPVHADFNNQGPQIGVNYTLEGTSAPSCTGDFNGDGAINLQDFLAYLQAFAAADPSADLNHDGLINLQDFLEFLAAYAAGC
jgi:hypothetical protein